MGDNLKSQLRHLQDASDPGFVPKNHSSFHAFVAYKLQLFSFIVSLRSATNVTPSPALIKPLEFDAAITRN